MTEGRRMRVDTTVVETNIHYPTDSSLLGDGVRVLIRTMKKITEIAGEAGDQAARPQPQRETAGARDRAGGARQRPAAARRGSSGAYRPIARFDQPGGGTGEAVLQGDCRRREAVDGRRAATGAGGPAPGTRRDGAARQAGDEADQSAHLPRRYARRRQDSSACSSHRRRSSARARPASPTSSARW